MLKTIGEELRRKISSFSKEDSLIFKNEVIKINQNNFQSIDNTNEDRSIAFIDGGQAEIISAANFCLSFIRVTGLKIKGSNKLDLVKKEFYLLTTAKHSNDDIYYESKIFGDKLILEGDLLISSNDQSIRAGRERASINKVADMARRFAELSLAKEIETDFAILDGTLEPTFKNEEKYLGDYCALAKSSSLFTASGNSPTVLLNKLKEGCWSYLVRGNTYFVKLHQKSKHVFRFEGNKEILPYLIRNCNDALFLGYPYGLILVDKMARVSNEEKNSLKMRFLLDQENKEIVEYLQTTNAHDILDNLG